MFVSRKQSIFPVGIGVPSIPLVGGVGAVAPPRGLFHEPLHSRLGPGNPVSLLDFMRMQGATEGVARRLATVGKASRLFMQSLVHGQGDVLHRASPHKCTAIVWAHMCNSSAVLA